LAARNVLDLKGLSAAKIHLLLRKEKEFRTRTIVVENDIARRMFVLPNFKSNQFLKEHLYLFIYQFIMNNLKNLTQQQ